mmetsp:Transcript_93204/g.247561  ORF Transcript_93204/g.247561 Transcript_93204/m.247561 type:complete len:201 (-) Transcript_93204:406-1008(-)
MKMVLIDADSVAASAPAASPGIAICLGIPHGGAAPSCAFEVVGRGACFGQGSPAFEMDAQGGCDEPCDLEVTAAMPCCGMPSWDLAMVEFGACFGQGHRIFGSALLEGPDSPSASPLAGGPADGGLTGIAAVLPLNGGRMECQGGTSAASPSGCGGGACPCPCIFGGNLMGIGKRLPPPLPWSAPGAPSGPAWSSPPSGA